MDPYCIFWLPHLYYPWGLLCSWSRLGTSCFQELTLQETKVWTKPDGEQDHAWNSLWTENNTWYRLQIRGREGKMGWEYVRKLAGSWFLCWHVQSFFIPFLDKGASAPEVFSTNKRWWSSVVAPFQILEGSQNGVLCLSAFGGHHVPCPPGQTIYKMRAVPGAEGHGWLWRHHSPWMWVPPPFASSRSPSASVFTLLSLPFSSPLSLNYRILIFFAYLFTLLSHLFIYLSFLPWSDPFRNSSFHLIKMLCDSPYLEVGWRAFSCLGIQVPIYAVPRHLCDTSFSSFPQGSAQYFTSVVMTHKP